MKPTPTGPTLHDAVVRELKVGFAERELTLVVDYSDLVLGLESEPNTRTRITMRWFGITESTLRMHNGDLYGIEICLEHNLTQNTFYRWRKRFAGASPADLAKNREIEKENVGYPPEGKGAKRLLAERDLEIDVLKELLGKK